MQKNSPTALTTVLGRGALCAALVVAMVAPAAAQTKVEEFYDAEYGYSFQYPAGWQIHNLPEGEANRDIRARLQGPNGGSFMAVVEKIGAKTAKEGFDSADERKARVEALMSQTIEQIYKTINENIKAVAMTVGERRDLSNEIGIKFYLATLHRMAAGKPIIVAGIHSFPFGKDYAVSFLMSGFLEGASAKEQEALTAVFNSFRLLGERPAADGSADPAATGSKKD